MQARIPEDYRKGFHWIAGLDAISTAVLGGGVMLGLTTAVNSPSVGGIIGGAFWVSLGAVFAFVRIPFWEQGGDPVWTWIRWALDYYRRERRASYFGSEAQRPEPVRRRRGRLRRSGEAEER